MPLLLRLVKLLVPIALIVVVLVLLFKLVAVPYAEGRAADAIGASLGADVKVHADAPIRPGLFRGDVGDLVVTSKRLERQGLTVNDVHARIHDASTNISKLLRGTVRVHFSRIDLSGRVPATSLAQYLRTHFADAGVHNANQLNVRVRPGILVAVLPSGEIPLHVKVSGPTTVRLSPAIGGPIGRAVGDALSAGIDFAPLPYGIQLRNVRLVQGAAIVTAGRGAGTETLQD